MSIRRSAAALAAVILATSIATPALAGDRDDPGIAWVASLFASPNGQVDVVDLQAGSVRTSITTDVAYPYGTAVSPDQRTVLVTDLFSGDVSIIDAGTATVVDTVAACGQPNGVAFGRFGRLAYVACTTDDELAIIDVAGGSRLGTVEIGDHPVGVAVGGTGRRVYVTLFDEDRLAIYDVLTGSITTVPTGADPTGVVAVGDRVFVANSGSGDVTVVDGWTGTVLPASPIALPAGATPEAIAADGDRVYVSNVGTGGIAEIDAVRLRVRRAIAVDGVWGIDVSGRFLVGTQAGFDTVVLIDRKRGTVVRTIPVGTLPLSLGRFVTRQ